MRLIRNQVVYIPQKVLPTFFNIYFDEESTYYVIIEDHEKNEIEKIPFDNYNAAKETFWNKWSRCKLNAMQG